jgi:hypothetical protein
MHHHLCELQLPELMQTTFKLLFALIFDYFGSLAYNTPYKILYNIHKQRLNVLVN